VKGTDPMQTLPLHYLGDATVDDDTAAGYCPWSERQAPSTKGAVLACPAGCLLPTERLT
jgi:hypothetical protein